MIKITYEAADYDDTIQRCEQMRGRGKEGSTRVSIIKVKFQTWLHNRCVARKICAGFHTCHRTFSYITNIHCLNNTSYFNPFFTRTMFAFGYFTPVGPTKVIILPLILSTMHTLSIVFIFMKTYVFILSYLNSF